MTYTEAKKEIDSQIETIPQKKCYCHTCDKSLHSLGIARHRAMHRDKKEMCRIMISCGQIVEYDFRSKK